MVSRALKALFTGRKASAFLFYFLTANVLGAFVALLLSVGMSEGLAIVCAALLFVPLVVLWNETISAGRAALQWWVDVLDEDPNLISSLPRALEKEIDLITGIDEHFPIEHLPQFEIPRVEIEFEDPEDWPGYEWLDWVSDSGGDRWVPLRRDISS